MIKIKTLPLLLLFIAMLITGCGNRDTSTALLELVAERDSLRSENNSQRKRLDTLNDMIFTINSALDSISMQENILFIDPESETQVSRDDVIRNLTRYEQVLKHQQASINQLRQSIQPDSANGSLDGMLGVMQQQLDAKDRQISILKSELAKKDVDITRLRKLIASQRNEIEEQTQTIAQLDRTTKVQVEALARQDEYINSAYVIVGTKKDLERKGIIKKKRLIPESALDKSKFAKIDIRKYREVTFYAKKPKILTDMPQRTYTLTTDGNGNFTLRITSPDDFWKVSNYLVIQTD